MRLAAWLLRALLFVALFAFALNNQQPVTVQGFFGAQWPASLAWVLLLAFAAGALVGVLAMLPHWWRARSSLSRPAARAGDAQDSQQPPPGTAANAGAADPAARVHPSRIGL